MQPVAVVGRQALGHRLYPDQPAVGGDQPVFVARLWAPGLAAEEGESGRSVVEIQGAAPEIRLQPGGCGVAEQCAGLGGDMGEAQVAQAHFPGNHRQLVQPFANFRGVSRLGSCRRGALAPLPAESQQQQAKRQDAQCQGNGIGGRRRPEALVPVRQGGEAVGREQRQAEC
ncbi:hypothetical protein D3C78_1197750 [compost metagenome]